MSTNLLAAAEPEVFEPTLGVSGDFPLDPAVVAAPPDGVQPLSAKKHGSSTWAATARIDVKEASGKNIGNSIKCSAESHAKAQLEGEYAAMLELWETAPVIIPRPIAWGRCCANDTYFLLMTLVNTEDKEPADEPLARPLPDPVTWDRISCVA